MKKGSGCSYNLYEKRKRLFIQPVRKKEAVVHTTCMKKEAAVHTICMKKEAAVHTTYMKKELQQNVHVHLN
jgi:hypothetical protein